MRIGIDARLWSETGVGRYIRNLVINLSEIDLQNEYVIFARGQDIDLIRSQISNPKFHITRADIRWHSLKEQVSFSRLLHQKDIDLMHFPYFSLPILYRKPFVVTIHDLIIHQFATGNASTLPLPLYALKRLGFKSVFNHAVRRSRKIIVPLESVKKEVISQFSLEKNKVVVTREGFDPSIISKKAPSSFVKKEIEKGKYFLYVGNAYPHKNVGFLLSGFFEFTHKHPGQRLILVGKDDYFYRQLKGVTSSHAVSFLHNISDADLGFLYTWAEAFVSASFMEGFGLPTLEAMAHSCPVLLSDIPSFREVSGADAIYFDPYKKTSLIKAFTHVIEEKRQVKKERVERAFLASKQFSWKAMAEQTKQIYESSVSI